MRGALGNGLLCQPRQRRGYSRERSTRRAGRLHNHVSLSRRLQCRRWDEGGVNHGGSVGGGGRGRRHHHVIGAGSGSRGSRGSGNGLFRGGRGCGIRGGCGLTTEGSCCCNHISSISISTSSSNASRSRITGQCISICKSKRRTGRRANGRHSSLRASDFRPSDRCINRRSTHSRRHRWCRIHKHAQRWLVEEATAHPGQHRRGVGWGGRVSPRRTRRANRQRIMSVRQSGGGCRRGCCRGGGGGRRWRGGQ